MKGRKGGKGHTEQRAEWCQVRLPQTLPQNFTHEAANDSKVPQPQHSSGVTYPPLCTEPGVGEDWQRWLGTISRQPELWLAGNVWDGEEEGCAVSSSNLPSLTTSVAFRFVKSHLRLVYSS